MLPAPTSKPEFNLLCSIARPRPALDRARELLGSGLDFPELLRLAAQHTVRPQLIRALGQLAWHGVPSDARLSLEAFQHRYLLRTLGFVEESHRVADAFEADGIPFAVFKGVALATSLYGDPSAREYNDIDVIVPEQRMADAESALASLGYGGVQGDRAFRQAFLSYQRQYALVRGDTGFAVDLHWAFSGAFLPFPLTADDVWRELHRVSIGGRGIPTLDGVNLALLLAGHGTKEQWRCLEWIGDVAMLIDRKPDLDWGEAYRRAHALGCGASVLLGCLLANGLLGVPMPKDLTGPVERNGGTRRRASALIERMRLGTPEPQVAPNFTDLDLCDRWPDRIRAVLGLTFAPTAGDYNSMPLPPALWGIYRFTRPFRLAARAVGGLF